MDIQKYQAVIDGVLRKLKVPSHQREDMMQECYLALLENETSVEKADFPLGYAEKTCRSQIIDIWRKEGRKVPTDSLDDPRINNKAVKLAEALPNVESDLMREAMTTLPPEELEVVTRLYVDGYSRYEVAAVLGVHANTVDNRSKSAVAKLKKYFGEA